MSITEVGSLPEFRAQIKGKTSVVDFYATWCGPCKAISPIVEKLSDSYPQHKFFKVDVDQANDIAREYGISAMPTFLLFQDGVKVGQVVGANPQGLKQAIDQLEQ
ncbi:unnamed protein product [Kuraishia capsulata CBS 1993]|uniref:Thioredoxin n=1 Tax=Kuraishia capsulata CBS 1993 TaxID=1382522 RepID=W6MGJ3_9ASCO|nr:uncharacterized protein KUCA_T00000903001 [Kuraishia capsulata CBS 1993]CDK24936.1 unnamed protein product [Kuraishia capsulata CBS 1993]